MTPSIAVVGATGLVGRTMLEVIAEHSLRYSSIKLLASARSAGEKIKFQGSTLRVEELRQDSFTGVDIALFSAGGEASRKFAPIAAQAGCAVVDNSSAWRMHSRVPLIVPEVNASALVDHSNIVANPNCSTIQMVVALKPLHDAFGLKRIVVSTYQSVSGAGQKGLDQLFAELSEKEPKQRISPHQLAFNTVFHSISDESGYSEEEIKMIDETRKIMGDSELDVMATCVRLPVLGGHGESVMVELERETTVEELRRILGQSAGIVVVDDPLNASYPTTIKAGGSDEVFVGRIRKDRVHPKTFHLWIVSDNLRKGAATNAVQIVRALVDGWTDGTVPKHSSIPISHWQ